MFATLPCFCFSVVKCRSYFVADQIQVQSSSTSILATPPVTPVPPSISTQQSAPSCSTDFDWVLLNDGDAVRQRIVDAYSELERLNEKRADLEQGDDLKTEKERAWYAAYEGFMHHAKYTLRFVKKLPGERLDLIKSQCVHTEDYFNFVCFRVSSGFKQLAMQDQVDLVRDAVYPITLLFHSQYFNPLVKLQRCGLAHTSSSLILHGSPSLQVVLSHGRRARADLAFLPQVPRAAGAHRQRGSRVPRSPAVAHRVCLPLRHRRLRNTCVPLHLLTFIHI